MKKALLLLGMIAAGAASGGVVAWSILSPAEKNGTHVVTPQSGAVSVDPFSQAGPLFTSYQAEQYPDLTYAAENAVKAVVNIEVVQEIEVPERQYDPFFEFFGIPQQGRRGPSTQERRGGGSGVIISADGYIVTNNRPCGGRGYAPSREAERRPHVRRQGDRYRPHDGCGAGEDRGRGPAYVAFRQFGFAPVGRMGAGHRIAL